MKKYILIACVICSGTLSAKKYYLPPPPNAPPPPGVPLDGGLIGLIAAGGALGYKKYKARNSNSQDDFKA